MIGDRWALLVVRELLFGPRRWTDLVDGLPGIGKNLLAQRLRDLQAAGIVAPVTLPWVSGRSALYSLAPRGEALVPVIMGLARFGVSLLPGGPPSDAVRPAWAVLALVAASKPSVRSKVVLEVDGEAFVLVLGRRGTVARRGVARRGVAPGGSSGSNGTGASPVFVTTAETLMDLAEGRVAAHLAPLASLIGLEPS